MQWPTIQCQKKKDKMTNNDPHDPQNIPKKTQS
jgi:hypothetical protein